MHEMCTVNGTHLDKLRSTVGINIREKSRKAHLADFKISHLFFGQM